MIKPTCLKKGDTVAVIAPASPSFDKNFNTIIKNIETLDLNPVLLDNCYKSHGHFAGTDQERVAAIHEAFRNPVYKGIICLRGGYGSPRLLPLVDYNLIKNNPKVFVGYSDITALHTAFNKISGIVTFHGPMASSSFDEVYSINALRKAIMSNVPLDVISNPIGEKMISLVDGVCKGHIVGGNLSLLVSTLGSPYEIDARAKILFIEEVNESNYSLDRMLTSLNLSGKFRDCVGIIFGTFTGCKPEYKNGIQKDLDLMTIIEEIIIPYRKPTVFNFRAGHNSPQPTIPFGVQAILNSKELLISIIESATEASHE
ncbi:MAG: LD-carboxypeptidase [Clostridiales bacterium]|nr:LD-carboxypeptidase [Clostridiales bacterium]